MSAGDGSDTARQQTVAWLKQHAVELTQDPAGRDLQAIGADSRGAKIVSFGESTHGTHEMLAIRNRIFEHLVEHEGVEALAVETGFREAFSIDDYLATNDDRDPSDDVVRSMMSWSNGGSGPGRSENFELLRWMHRFNREHHGQRRIHVYGFDLSGRAPRGGFPNAAAPIWAAVEQVRTVDRAAADGFARRFQPLAASFRHLSYSDRPYDRLDPGARDKISALVAELDRWFRLHPAGSRTSSSEDYERGAHGAIEAGELDRYFHVAFGQPGMSDDAVRCRDSIMAENVAWTARNRVAHEGRLFVFAHDEHVEKGSGNSMGSFMAQHPERVFTIGTIDAERQTAEGPLPLPTQGPEGLGTTFAEVPFSGYVVDLRALPDGDVRTWLAQPRSVNPGSMAQTSLEKIRVTSWFDAVVFVRTLHYVNS